GLEWHDAGAWDGGHRHFRRSERNFLQPVCGFIQHARAALSTVSQRTKKATVQSKPSIHQSPF
ncbi:hypothetical protein, partial [Mesorhizobium sp. M1C.F.Ca.ET.144.01.1.1]|uniref:hypothetical protein n=1 Tax=Mesorhizobium sp. M1C.F.Ca.ET.144.01.1.1 TaxID=2563921 RepID=UPI001AEDB2CA